MDGIKAAQVGAVNCSGGIEERPVHSNESKAAQDCSCVRQVLVGAAACGRTISTRAIALVDNGSPTFSIASASAPLSGSKTTDFTIADASR